MQCGYDNIILNVFNTNYNNNLPKVKAKHSSFIIEN